MKVAGLHLGTWVSTWSKGWLLQGGLALKALSANTFTSPCPQCPGSFSRDEGRPQLSLQEGMLRVSNSPGTPHRAIPPTPPRRLSASPAGCWSFPGLESCSVVVAGGASGVPQGQLRAVGIAGVFQLLQERVPHPDLCGTCAIQGCSDPHTSQVGAANGHPVRLVGCR